MSAYLDRTGANAEALRRATQKSTMANLSPCPSERLDTLNELKGRLREDESEQIERVDEAIAQAEADLQAQFRLNYLLAKTDASG